MSLMADIPLVYIYIFALLLRNKQTSFNQPGPNSFCVRFFCVLYFLLEFAGWRPRKLLFLHSESLRNELGW